MNPHSSLLAASVAAVNRAHAEAMKLYAAYEPVIRGLVGQKVIKADGALLVTVAKMLPAMEKPRDGEYLAVYRLSSDYSLAWIVKISENYKLASGRESCIYHEVTVYIGQMTGAILSSMYDPLGELRTDWTEKEVGTKREALKEAENTVSDAKRALYPFETYDRGEREN